MQIGAIAYPNYVYNTNRVSSLSLNRMNKIPDDVLSSRLDYGQNSLTGENINPLRPGESKNFMDILTSQMEMGRANAARIMTEDPFATGDAAAMEMVEA